MTKDEAARFLRLKLSKAKDREIPVTLRWKEAKDIIDTLERSGKEARHRSVPGEECSGAEI